MENFGTRIFAVVTVYGFFSMKHASENMVRTRTIFSKTDSNHTCTLNCFTQITLHICLNQRYIKAFIRLLVIPQSKQHTMWEKFCVCGPGRQKDVTYFNILREIELEAKQRAVALSEAIDWLDSAM
jgi:hypothetical protein